MTNAGTAPATRTLPLTDVTVIDLTDGVAGVTGRLLAELGADVVLIEPPGGVASRRTQPTYSGHGLEFATTHANKRSIELNLHSPAGRARFLALTDSADLVLESQPVGDLDGIELSADVLRERNAHLVVVSITPFGQFGPYLNFAASESVLLAMSSLLTRSGAPGREPLIPPGRLGGQTAAIDAAVSALLALRQARSCGEGQHVDCALFDLIVQGLDPGYLVAGSATLGQPLHSLPPGRPDVSMMYPIIECADGYVRLFIGAAKQWRALFAWMGEPAVLADPAYEQIITRFTEWAKIWPEIQRFFATQTRDELVTHAAQRGIALAALNTPTDVLRSEHVRYRQSFIQAEIAPGVTGMIANGCIEIDGTRAGFRRRAPRLDEHAADTTPSPAPREPVTSNVDAPRPLGGLRVLDLGVIVVGAETGRIMADHGADVIKVESRAHQDGIRQADTDTKVGYSFVLGSRGKRSLGLDLRSEAGKHLFNKLAATSDVVLSNFKPGTLNALGIDYESLRRENPRLIVVESSALGDTGPWSNRMGYGPLVRATVGLTSLWRHPDDPYAFGDGLTVYPDHAAARMGVLAVLAALIDRDRTGRGCRITVSQMDTVLCQLATEYLRESLHPGTLSAAGNIDEFDAPSGIYRCAGQDAYCAVSVQSDSEWTRLARAIERPDLADDPAYATSADRVGHRDVLEEALASWLTLKTSSEAQQHLQQAGVAAGAAVHVGDLLDDHHLKARGQFGKLAQPGYPAPLDVSTGPAIFGATPTPELKPAPPMAADTRQICHQVLGLTNDEVDALVSAGVLQVHTGSDSERSQGRD